MTESWACAGRATEIRFGPGEDAGERAQCPRCKRMMNASLVAGGLCPTCRAEVEIERRRAEDLARAEEMGQARTCPVCGRKFIPSRHLRVYCSRDCSREVDRIRHNERNARIRAGKATGTR